MLFIYTLVETYPYCTFHFVAIFYLKWDVATLRKFWRKSDRRLLDFFSASWQLATSNDFQGKSEKTSKNVLFFIYLLFFVLEEKSRFRILWSLLFQTCWLRISDWECCCGAKLKRRCLILKQIFVLNFFISTDVAVQKSSSGACVSNAVCFSCSITAPQQMLFFLVA